MMELILKTPIEELIPKLIAFNNDEIINQLKPQLAHYKDITYTENELPIAKQDRAKLNKFKDAIEDERKRVKKAYLEPYEKFEFQVKEITTLIDETAKTIDLQVKTFEDNKKAEKKSNILEFWKDNIGDLNELIKFNNVFSEQWLNTTYSMKKVQEDIVNFISKIRQDLAVIETLNFKQENYLKDYYLRTFDLTATLQEKTRLEDNERKLNELAQKQAQEQAKSTPVKEISQEEIKVVDFRIWATKEQLQIVREFLINNKIKYGKVPMEEK